MLRHEKRGHQLIIYITYNIYMTILGIKYFACKKLFKVQKGIYIYIYNI